MQTETLSDNEIRDFRALARCIIPPNATYDVPGADDDLIFADILRSLERDHDRVRQALAQRLGAEAVQRRVDEAAALPADAALQRVIGWLRG